MIANVDNLSLGSSPRNKEQKVKALLQSPMQKAMSPMGRTTAMTNPMRNTIGSSNDLVRGSVDSYKTAEPQPRTGTAPMQSIPENKYVNNYVSNPVNESAEQDYEALMSESEAKRRGKATRASAIAGSGAQMMSPKSTVASDRRRKAK